MCDYFLLSIFFIMNYENVKKDFNGYAINIYFIILVKFCNELWLYLNFIHFRNNEKHYKFEEVEMMDLSNNNRKRFGKILNLNTYKFW